MHIRHSFRLLLFVVLLAGLCLLMGGQARPAHAQTTLTVSNCSNDSQLQADVAQANTDKAGDIINFSCSGDIPLTGTLNINANMTLDGSGQQVTLDGQNSVQVLSVYSLTFNLNALTIVHAKNFGIQQVSGEMSISNSTFAYNSDVLSTSGHTMNISNSTIAYNSGYAVTTESGTITSISNSTIAYNSRLALSGGEYVEGSIVAYNSGGNCDGTGDVTSEGYNLESGSECGFTSTGDLQNTDPKLDPGGLHNNGGPTQTIALQQSSPAIDQIPATSCPTTDQRGTARPDNAESSCDMGAYEFKDAALTVSVAKVNATEGSAFNGVVATGTASGATNPLSASIAWGDGSSSTGSVTSNADGSYSVSGSHTYSEEGSYTVTVSVKDSGSQSASGSGPASVADAALNVTKLGTVARGRTVALGALFNDADPGGTVTDYHASITWGDSTTSTASIVKNPVGSGFALGATHTYGKHGTYTITLTISDTGGSQVTQTVKVTV